jgi:hypothetical protein
VGRDKADNQRCPSGGAMLALAEKKGDGGEYNRWAEVEQEGFALFG